MRTKKEYKKISVTKEIYDRLIDDRNEFEKIIGCGKWSISDTITEYYKIMNAFKENQK